MTRLVDRSRVVGMAFCTAALAISVPAGAQSEALVQVRFSGLRQAFTAPADEGVARAMSMFTQRLKEIPTEISMMADDEEAKQAMAMFSSVMPLIAGMIDQPCEFTLIDHGGMSGMLPDMDVRLIVETGNAEATRQMFDAMQFVAKMATQHEEGLTLAPESDSKRMTLTLPIGQFVFGPADDAQTRFVAGFDSAGDGIDMESFTVPTPDELKGSKLDAQAYVNVKSIARVVTRVLDSQGEPAAQQIEEMLAQVLPEGDLDLIAGSTIKGGRRWSVLRVRGAVTTMENVMATVAGMTGMAPPNMHPDPLSVDAFTLVPHNVTTASVQMQDLSSLAAPMQMAAFQIGVPELVDVIDALGKTWVSYMSDETGGGGLMSLVLIQSDVNAEAMTDALDALSNTANLHAAPLHGYVRMRNWEARDAKGGPIQFHSLAFPGLPVPVELSMSVVDNHFVIGVTPQAVFAAVDHWRSGRPSLLDNPRFKEASAGLLGNAVKVTFMDMPANLNRGYPVAQLVGSAIANFVRSPVNQARDPGIVTPSLATLSKNAKAAISVTSIQGGDFVMISNGDPSMMVNIAGGAGSVGITPAIIGAAVAIAIAQEARGEF